MSNEDWSEIIGKHILYNYHGLGHYEGYFQSRDVFVYKIHGGPMEGRSSYQKTYSQKVRDHIYNFSWIEETGTIVTITVDMELMKITCFIAFSQGHWEKNKDAHGDKRNPTDLERWRGLSKIGDHTTRKVHLDVGTILKVSEGPCGLEPITEGMPFF